MFEQRRPDLQRLVIDSEHLRLFLLFDYPATRGYYNRASPSDLFVPNSAAGKDIKWNSSFGGGISAYNNGDYALESLKAVMNPQTYNQTAAFTFSQTSNVFGYSFPIHVAGRPNKQFAFRLSTNSVELTDGSNFLMITNTLSYNNPYFVIASVWTPTASLLTTCSYLAINLKTFHLEASGSNIFLGTRHNGDQTDFSRINVSSQIVNTIHNCFYWDRAFDLSEMTAFTSRLQRLVQ